MATTMKLTYQIWFICVLFLQVSEYMPYVVKGSIMGTWLDSQHMAHQRVHINVVKRLCYVIRLEGRAVSYKDRVHIMPAVVVTMVTL